jgi:hypothetical protein
MAHSSNLIYERTVNNGEAMAGLRVDIGSLETRLGKEVAELKMAINLQGDRLRQDLTDATSGFRADVTGLRELMDARFQKVDGHLKGIGADMDQRFEAVDQRFEAVDQRFEAVDQRFDAVDRRFDAVDRRFDGVDQRLDTLDGKLDTILAELRRPAI